MKTSLFWIQLYYVSRTLLRLLPLRTTVVLTKLLGRFASLFCAREITFAKAQIGFAFAKKANHSPTEKTQTPDPCNLARTKPDRFVRNVFAHVGQCIGELLILDKLSAVHPQQESIDSKLPTFTHISFAHKDTFVSEVHDSQKGALTLSAHIGCFELLLSAYCKCKLDIRVIRRSPNYEFVSRMLDHISAQHNATTIWSHESGAASKIITTLREGGVIAALIDQDAELGNRFSSFFGLPASSPVSLIKLTLKQRLPVFSTFIVRTAPLEHMVFTKRIEYAHKLSTTTGRISPNEMDTACQFILDMYNKDLEDIICRYPDQWIWWHRRWRRRPGIDYAKTPERLRSSKEYIKWLSTMEQKKLCGECLDND